LGVGDGLRLVLACQGLNQRHELRAAADDEQRDAPRRAAVEHHLDGFRVRELQACGLGEGLDGHAPQGGVPVGLGAAGPLADGEGELRQVLPQHGEGAPLPALGGQYLPEGHERLVGEGKRVSGPSAPRSKTFSLYARSSTASSGAAPSLASTESCRVFVMLLG